jgi:hypothetical protein
VSPSILSGDTCETKPAGNLVAVLSQSRNWDEEEMKPGFAMTATSLWDALIDELERQRFGRA